MNNLHKYLIYNIKFYILISKYLLWKIRAQIQSKSLLNVLNYDLSNETKAYFVPRVTKQRHE